MTQEQQYIDTLKSKAEEAGLPYKKIYTGKNGGDMHVVMQFALSEPFGDQLLNIAMNIADGPSETADIDSRCATIVDNALSSKKYREKVLAAAAAKAEGGK